MRQSDFAMRIFCIRMFRDVRTEVLKHGVFHAVVRELLSFV